MDPLLELARAATGAASTRVVGHVQSLWSGYGEIVRIALTGGTSDATTVIGKRVEPPGPGRHPRGWGTSRSHARKLRSYAVERTFYDGYSRRCDAPCRVPTALATEEQDGRWLFVLEDLDAAGFSGRRGDLGARHAERHACLAWLAHFHATFLTEAPDGLWPEGTYWHLETRPDELAAMSDDRLRAAAAALDARLTGARYRTIVHGDAKVANFCFPNDAGGAVAAVDFQYVGGGCGMKDIQYFLGSCLSERQLERHAGADVDAYFRHLRAAVRAQRPGIDADALEREWRDLEAVAWADFCRFLDGWAPGHHKLHGYSRKMTERALVP